MKTPFRPTVINFIEEKFMWYFTWILGVLLACAFGIINAMWLENSMTDEHSKDTDNE